MPAALLDARCGAPLPGLPPRCVLAQGDARHPAVLRHDRAEAAVLHQLPPPRLLRAFAPVVAIGEHLRDEVARPGGEGRQERGSLGIAGIGCGDQGVEEFVGGHGAW